MWDFFWIRKDRERNELWKRANEALFKAQMDTILWRQRKAEEAARPFNWDATPDLAQATWDWPERKHPVRLIVSTTIRDAGFYR
jgi:hypothetical protein